MALDKSQILEAKDREYDYVDVPEWGGEVRIQSLSAQERDDYHEHLVELEVDQEGNPKAKRINNKDAEALLCALGIVDEDGNRLFQKGDYKELRKKSARAIDRIARAIRDLSDMSEQEAAKKNSDSDRSEGSSSS